MTSASDSRADALPSFVACNSSSSSRSALPALSSRRKQLVEEGPEGLGTREQTTPHQQLACSLVNDRTSAGTSNCPRPLMGRRPVQDQDTVPPRNAGLKCL
jgi:hypothetical protein